VHGHLCYPQRNKHLVFRGNLQHGLPNPTPSPNPSPNPNPNPSPNPNPNPSPNPNCDPDLNPSPSPNPAPKPDPNQVCPAASRAPRAASSLAAAARYWSTGGVRPRSPPTVTRSRRGGHTACSAHPPRSGGSPMP
jgi:outer membrane biosynthesis protein TonB